MNNKSTYKVLNIFGDEETRIVESVNKKRNLFSDYDGFLDKFEVKKSTDDCYTPKEVFNIVVDYVNEIYPLNDKKIIRPFFPGGDFEGVDYSEDCVVVDNPPFSIVTKICRYYIEKGIKFFLFCPHLTAFSPDIDCTHIIASADITYENGATINTSFVSNMFGSLKIIGDAGLHQKLKEIQDKQKVNLPKYEYPDNILTVSKVAYCVERGVSLMIDKKDAKHYRAMDEQKKYKKGLFGSGFIVSDFAAQAQAQAQAQKKENVIIWKLSQKEREIINSLGG